MGLIALAKRRWHVWSWRARYFWMDTKGGEQARIVVFCMALLVVLMQLIRMAVAAFLPPPPDEPVKAVYWWVIQLIIAIVFAVVAYAMRPKTEQPQAREVSSPTVEDGTAAKDYFGTCWINHDDNFLLGWKVVGRDPIRSKGGK